MQDSRFDDGEARFSGYRQGGKLALATPRICHNNPVTTRKPKPVLDARQLHRITRALADPRRFEIFQQIAAGHGCTACTNLRESFPITAPTLSHHLKELETAGLIDATRDGKFMNLSLRRDIWQAYLAELKNI
jgi:ArsR family transcriptional regulator